MQLLNLLCPVGQGHNGPSYLQARGTGGTCKLHALHPELNLEPWCKATVLTTSPPSKEHTL